MTQAHIDGIAALLNAAGVSVYDTEADDPTRNPADWSDASWQSQDWTLRYPYVVLAAPSLNRVADSLCDTPMDFHDYVRITAAGTGPEQARWVQEKAFAALDRKSPAVADYRTQIKRTATGVLAVDREVTLPGSGHPIYATDTYLYRATPTA